jgi:hemerythrin
MYKWDTFLETGNETVDNQHKQCFIALYKLIDAIKNGEGKEEIIKTLNFLKEYVIMHFSAEELLMKENNYMDYSLHKRYHDEYKITVDELLQQLNSEGISWELINNVTFSLNDWLVNHIKSEDFRMAAFIKTKGKKV